MDQPQVKWMTCGIYLRHLKDLIPAQEGHKRSKQPHDEQTKNG